MTRSPVTSLSTLALALSLAAPAAAGGAGTVALLPVQDRAGDSGVARAVELVVARELSDRHEVLDPEGLRDALRRRRIRSVDDTAPGRLRELAAEVGADRLVTVVLHHAERDLTPRLALSGRSYDGATGEVAWAGFESGSGLDGRTLLGLGVVEEAEELAARLARRLVDGLETGAAASSGEATVAVLPLSGPLSGSSEGSGTGAAETATEIVRSALVGRGVTVVSPNRVFRALYGRSGDEGAVGWGAVDAGTRRALREEGADLVLTGSVERWETSGDGFEPEPVVTVALRAVDAGSGRILWTGARDRRGWDAETVFRLGRIHDHGTLAHTMIDRMIHRMIDTLAGQLTKETAAAGSAPAAASAARGRSLRGRVASAVGPDARRLTQAMPSHRRGAGTPQMAPRRRNPWAHGGCGRLRRCSSSTMASHRLPGTRAECVGGALDTHRKTRARGHADFCHGLLGRTTP